MTPMMMFGRARQSLRISATGSRLFLHISRHTVVRACSAISNSNSNSDSDGHAIGHSDRNVRRRSPMECNDGHSPTACSSACIAPMHTGGGLCPKSSEQPLARAALSSEADHKSPHCDSVSCTPRSSGPSGITDSLH
jgi:hypothetical protein